MKKVLKRILVMLMIFLICILPAVALADTGEEISADFFSWATLATYAGAVLATSLIVQFTKELPGIKKLPTRLWAYIISLVIMVLATLFTVTPISFSVILLCFVNAVIVAMAATGTYDAVAPLSTKTE